MQWTASTPAWVRVPVPGRRYNYVSLRHIELVEPVFKIDPVVGAQVEVDECYLHFSGSDGRMRIEVSATKFIELIGTPE